MEPKMQYYILYRQAKETEYQIVAVVHGVNPLHGYGSWSLYRGPFNTWGEAEAHAPRYWLEV